MKLLTHDSIQCRADATDAEEYDLWVGTRLYRVTAHSKEDATAFAQEYDRNRNELEAEERRDGQADLPL